MFLSCQLLIGERPRTEQPGERVAEEIRILAVVKAKLKFIEVSIQMLGADLMIRTDHRSLEQAPNALDAVGVNVSADPLFFVVIDSFVLRVGIPDATVGPPLIGDDPLRLGGERSRCKAV